MPHIRVRAVEYDHLVSRSGRIVDRLAEKVGCDRSWFTLELVETRFVADGKPCQPNPFVEVLWFPRDAETKKAVAAILDEELRGRSEYVTVVFTDLERGDYFEKGEHY